MTLHISDEDGIRILKELAAERPEYVYEKQITDTDPEGVCLYRNPDGQPGCIVGHLVDRLHPGFDFSNWEQVSIQSLARPGQWYFQVSMSEKLRRMLARAQDHQDDGIAWGDAVRYAEEFADVCPD